MLVVTESNFKITQAAEKMDCRQWWKHRDQLGEGKWQYFMQGRTVA